MGLSSSKTKTTQTNRPVYSGRIEGASDQLSSVYNANSGNVQRYADMIGGLTPDLLERFREGDPAINAASGYITDTLGGDPQNNPYLDDIIAQTGDNTRRQIQTGLGTRGGIGGSSERDIVSRALAENESGLRYSDYDNQMNRRAQAASMAPGVAAGGSFALNDAMSAAGFGATLPGDVASQYAAGQGGLLGQYQTVNGTQTQSGGMLGQIIGAGLGGWASGGFRGLGGGGG